MIDLNILSQFPAPEPFEHDAMHLARFTFDADIPVSFTVVPAIDDPAAAFALRDPLENALDDIAFMHCLLFQIGAQDLATFRWHIQGAFC